MLRGTIALQSTAKLTSMAVPTDYTMFVFDDAIGLTPLSGATKALKLVSLAKNTHGVAQVAKFAGKRTEKKKRAAQDELIAEIPADLTPDQLTVHFEDAHYVPMDAIESLKVTTGAPLAGHMRQTLLEFSFAAKEGVDPYMYKRLGRQRQSVSGDPGEAMELLTAALGDRIEDKRRRWGK